MNIFKLKSIVGSFWILLRNCNYAASNSGLKYQAIFLLIFLIFFDPISGVNAQQTTKSTCGTTTRMDVAHKGILNKGKVDVPLVNTTTKGTIECTCRKVNTGNCPGSVVFTLHKPNGTTQNVTARAKNMDISDDNRFPSVIYRTTYNSAVTKVTYNPPAAASRNSMRGLVIWQESPNGPPNLPNGYVVDRFFYKSGSKKYNISVPNSNIPRNFTIHIPVHEHGDNDRPIDYDIKAYDSSGSEKGRVVRIPTRDNDENEIRLDRLYLNDIVGSVSRIQVSIKSSESRNGSSVLVGTIMTTSTPCCTPSINCKPDIVRLNDAGSCTYKVKGAELDATLAGDCAAALSNNINGKSTLAGVAFPKGKTTITWLASNLATCKTTITVNDNPVCPENTCFLSYSYNNASCTCNATEIQNDCDDKKECTKDSVDPVTCECVNEYIDSENTCNLQDWYALKALYDSTDGDYWINNEGWRQQFSNDCPPENCSLSGLYRVTLNDDGRVKAVNSYNNNLKGPLPPEIGDLSELTDLYLSSVDFMGSSIPPEIGKLSKLENLFFISSGLSGKLPPELGNLTNLIDLRLNDNSIAENIPQEMANLMSLENLYLYNNKMVGCYQSGLKSLCAQLKANTNADISSGNNFDASWKDFCDNEEGACNNFRLSQKGYSLQPNPSNGKVFVEYENESGVESRINVYNSFGKQFKNFLQKFDDNSAKLDLNILPKGVYLIEVRSKQSSHTQKLILH